MRTSPDIVESHLELEERIRRRAHQIWEEGGRQEGRDLEHWLEAEQEVLGSGKQPAQDRGTVVGDAHTPDIVFSKAS